MPKVVGEVIDRAMQVHGAEGICRTFPVLPSHFRMFTDLLRLAEDQPLAALWAGIRTLRFADVSHSASSPDF